jgi:hypothetical protein
LLYHSPLHTHRPPPSTTLPPPPPQSKPTPVLTLLTQPHPSCRTNMPPPPAISCAPPHHAWYPSNPS